METVINRGDTFIKIENPNEEELSVYFQTSEVQLLRMNEPNPGVFVAESGKVALRALAASYEPVSALVDSESMGEEEWEVCRLLQGKRESIPIYSTTKEIIKSLRGFQLTRGLMCVMRRKIMPSLSEIVEGKSRIAVLDDVENPTNVGAIFRSGAALHMDAFLVTKGCADPLYRRAARVSMGTVFQIPWTYVDDDYLGQLQHLGIKTVAMALCEDSYELGDERLKREEKLAVIMGNEGNGLSTETLEKTDYTVMIPMSHGVDSLNVAAASAVAFWELSKHV